MGGSTLKSPMPLNGPDEAWSEETTEAPSAIGFIHGPRAPR